MAWGNATGGQSGWRYLGRMRSLLALVAATSIAVAQDIYLPEDTARVEMSIAISV